MLASGVEIWWNSFKYSMWSLLIIFLLVSSNFWDFVTFVVDVSSCFSTWLLVKLYWLKLFHFLHINKSFWANCKEPLKYFSVQPNTKQFLLSYFSFDSVLYLFSNYNQIWQVLYPPHWVSQKHTTHLKNLLVQLY